MSLLGAFNNQLIRFFEELVDSFPEEKEIKMGLEALQGAKKINPKLILDLFYLHVYVEGHKSIEEEDEADEDGGDGDATEKADAKEDEDT